MEPPVPAPPRRRPALPPVLAIGGAVVLAGAWLLPWRGDGLSEPDPLLELARRAPQVVGLYLAGLVLTSAAAVATVLTRPGVSTHRAGRGGPARAALVLGAGAVVLTLLAWLAIPLPNGRVFGSNPDGQFFEFDVPSYRAWGSYVAVAAASACFVAAALAVRRLPPLGRADPWHRGRPEESDPG